MKNFYLVAAVIGAIIPISFFLQFFGQTENAVLDFVPALFVNGASSGFTADLLISSFVFWTYMFHQKGSGPKPWLFIALNLCIGLSCALPAYLFARARTNDS
jgi:hypothetical protein